MMAIRALHLLIRFVCNVAILMPLLIIMILAFFFMIIAAMMGKDNG